MSLGVMKGVGRVKLITQRTQRGTLLNVASVQCRHAAEAEAMCQVFGDDRPLYPEPEPQRPPSRQVKRAAAKAKRGSGAVTMTPDQARTARAIYGLEPPLRGEVEQIEGLEAFLKRVPVERRPPDRESRMAAATTRRDEMQARMDRLHHETRVSPDMPHGWPIGVMRARLAYRGRLVWVTKVERLGGPRAGVLLVRIRELELDGAAPMSPDCPVVQVLALEDDDRARRRSRGLERATGAVG